MKILVACEESQAVTIAFRALGHEAYSCDIKEPSGGHPEWHYRGDALPLIREGGWDMIIAHPPCTYLSSCQSYLIFRADGSIKDQDRYEKGLEAAAFFMKFYNADCPRIAIENPTPIKKLFEKVGGRPRISQIIEPYMFGDPWRKRTCLWLKGLPPLIAMKEAPVIPLGCWVESTSNRKDPTYRERYQMRGHKDAKMRSKTFPGIARAMAEQWGVLCDRT